MNAQDNHAERMVELYASLVRVGHLLARRKRTKCP